MGAWKERKEEETKAAAGGEITPTDDDDILAPTALLQSSPPPPQTPDKAGRSLSDQGRQGTCSSSAPTALSLFPLYLSYDSETTIPGVWHEFARRLGSFFYLTTRLISQIRLVARECETALSTLCAVRSFREAVFMLS